jgi:hypothetical protein
LLTLPFHDAGERKYLFFEGYIGRESDGLDPLFPPMSRYEAALFKLFGSKPPIVISWETIIPALHYGLMSVLLIVMLVKLPFTPVALTIASVFASVLIVLYFVEIHNLWTLLKLRYRGRSIGELLFSLFSSLNMLKSSNDSEAGGPEGDGAGEDLNEKG